MDSVDGRFEAEFFLISPSVVGDEIGDFFEVSTIRREVRLVDLYRMPYSFAPLICAPIL